MAQYFRALRGLTSDHENIPHENLVYPWWAWLSAVQRCTMVDIASTNTYVCVSVTFYTANRSRRLEVSRTCLSCKHGLKASDARLEFETAQRYFDFSSHSQAPTSHVRTVDSDNLNCPRRGNHEKT